MKKETIYLLSFYLTILLIVLLLWSCNQNTPLGTKTVHTVDVSQKTGGIDVGTNYNYDLRTDTFMIYNFAYSGAEFRLQNSTRHTENGLLTNIDTSGLTIFRKLDLVNINDTAIGIVGQDTIHFDGLPKSYVDNVPIVFANSGGSTNVDASQSRTVFVANRNGASSFALPTPVPGIIYTFCSNSAFSMHVLPGTGRFIKKDGSETTSGGAMSSSGVAGNAITIVAISTNTWIVLSYTGTWTVS